MPFLLRLPESLDVRVRQRAAEVGISINALVCVALDAYLRTPAKPASSAPVNPPGASIPSSPPPGPPPPALTRRQRRELERRQKLDTRTG